MKKQATRTNGAPKKPVAQKIGSGATRATMGLTFWLGRTGARVGKGIVKGAAEAGREIRRGYDEAADK